MRRIFACAGRASSPPPTAPEEKQAAGPASPPSRPPLAVPQPPARSQGAASILTYLDHGYLPLIRSHKYPSASPAGATQPKTIWQYWGQGAETAPPLIRVCLESVSRHCGDCEIHVLDDRTLHDCVSIPPHILQRLDSGVLSRAHFSDYLRTCLLLQHGGIWLDATVYLSGPLPAAIEGAAFFIYKSSLFHSLAQLPPQVLLNAPIDQYFPPWHRMIGSSWCMAAAPGCRLLELTKVVLETYWKRESRLIDYFFFHHTLTWLLYRDPACAEIFQGMPSLSNLPTHLMQTQLLQPYQKQLDDAIRAATPIHKLTYKYDPPQQRQGLTLHHLLAEGR